VYSIRSEGAGKMSHAPLTPHMQLSDWEHVPTGTVCALVKKYLKRKRRKKSMIIILTMSCNQKEKTEIPI
jgi:hypothetical protein